MSTRSTGTSPRHILFTDPAASEEVESDSSPDRSQRSNTERLQDLKIELRGNDDIQTEFNRIKAEAPHNFEKAFHKLLKLFSALAEGWNRIAIEYHKELQYSKKQEAEVGRIPSLLEKLDVREVENNNKEQQVIDLTNKNELLVAEKQALNDHNSRLEQQINDLTDRISQLQSSEERHQELLEDSQLARTKLASKLTKLESELAMTNSQNEDLKRELSDTGHFLEHACHMNDLLSMDLDRYITQTEDTQDAESQVQSIPGATRSMIAPADALSKIQELTSALSQSNTSSGRSSYELTVIDAVDARPSSLNEGQHRTGTTPLQESHSIVGIDDDLSDANMNPVQPTENSRDATSQSVTKRIYENASPRRIHPHLEENKETPSEPATPSSHSGSNKTAPSRASDSTASQGSTVGPTSHTSSQTSPTSTPAANQNLELDYGTENHSGQVSAAGIVRENIDSQSRRPPPRDIRPGSVGTLSSDGSSISPKTVPPSKQIRGQVVSEPATVRRRDAQGQVSRRPKSLPTYSRNIRPPRNDSHSNAKLPERSGTILRQHQQETDEAETRIDHNISGGADPVGTLLPSPTGSTDSHLDTIDKESAVRLSSQPSRSVTNDQDQLHQNTFQLHKGSSRGSSAKSKPPPYSLDTVEARSNEDSQQPPTASTNASVGVMLSRAIDSLTEDGELSLTTRNKCIQYLQDNDLTSSPRSQILTDAKDTAAELDQPIRSMPQGERLTNGAASEPVDSNIQPSFAIPRRFSQTANDGSPLGPLGISSDVTTRQNPATSGELNDEFMARQSRDLRTRVSSDHELCDSLQDGSTLHSPTQHSDVAVKSETSEHENIDMQSVPQYLHPHDNSGGKTLPYGTVGSRKGRIAFLGVIGPMSAEARQSLDVKQSRHPGPLDGARLIRTAAHPDESIAEQILMLSEELEAAEIVDTNHLQFVPSTELKKWGQRHLFTTNSSLDINSTIEVGQDDVDAVKEEDFSDTHSADVGEESSITSSSEDDSTDHHEDAPPPGPVPVSRQLKEFKITLRELFSQGADIVRQIFSTYLSPRYLFTNYVIDRATEQTNHPASSLLVDLVFVALILPFVICGEAVRRTVIAVRSWFNAPGLTRWIHFLLAAWFLYFAYTIGQIHDEWFVANTSNMRERVFAWREERWDSSVLEHVRWYSQRAIERQFYRDECFILT